MDVPQASSATTEVPEIAPLMLCLSIAQENQPPDGHAETPNRRHIWPCTAGQTIAIARPADQVPPNVPNMALEGAHLGKHVAWNADRTAVIAQKQGHVLFDARSIAVSETLEFAADLDAAGGPVIYAGPVLVRGSVLDLVKLSVQGDITVNGSVEAAGIESSNDLVVHHGICGKEHGKVSARGNVRARFASNARISATDVCIANEVLNSRIICRGQFHAENAAILSGHITAIGGICCESAGSEAGIHVMLELALDPEETQRVNEIVSEVGKLHAQARQIHSSVDPLMKNPKLLSSKQKEKATELLFVASEAEAKASQLTASLDVPRQKVEALTKCCIDVRGKLFPGVIIRIAGFQSTIKKLFRGPLKIHYRSEAGKSSFEIVDSRHQSIASLPAVLDQASAIHLPPPS